VVTVSLRDELLGVLHNAGSLASHAGTECTM
jgi:hypothetical protein